MIRYTQNLVILPGRHPPSQSFTASCNPGFIDRLLGLIHGELHTVNIYFTTKEAAADELYEEPV